MIFYWLKTPENLKIMSDQVLKTVEDVIKWTVNEKSKVMLIRNIINGKLQLDDPELVEHFKTSLAQVSKHQPEPQPQQPQQPQQQPFEFNNTVTNMVFFDGNIWFSLKDENKLYIIDLNGVLVKTLTTSYNVIHLAAGKNFIYHSDKKNRVVRWRKYSGDMFIGDKFISVLTNEPKIISLFVDENDDDKIYIGNEKGSVNTYNLSQQLSPIFSIQTLSKPVTHIRKYDKTLVMASEHEFQLYSMETGKVIHYEKTYGRVMSILDKDRVIYVFTSEGYFSYKYDGTSTHSNFVTTRYYSTTYKSGALIHNHSILVSTHPGPIIDVYDGKIIVNNSFTDINDKLIMLIHNDKLYSTGSKHRIQITDLSSH